MAKIFLIIISTLLLNGCSQNTTVTEPPYVPEMNYHYEIQFLDNKNNINAKTTLTLKEYYHEGLYQIENSNNYYKFIIPFSSYENIISLSIEDFVLEVKEFQTEDSKSKAMIPSIKGTMYNLRLRKDKDNQNLFTYKGPNKEVKVFKIYH